MPFEQGSWSLNPRLAKKMRELKISPSKVLEEFMLGVIEGNTTIHVLLRNTIRKAAKKELELIGNG